MEIMLYKKQSTSMKPIKHCKKYNYIWKLIIFQNKLVSLENILL